MGRASRKNRARMSCELVTPWGLLERAAIDDDVGLMELLCEACALAGVRIWELSGEISMGGGPVEMDALLMALSMTADEVLEWLVVHCMDRFDESGDPAALECLETFSVRCLAQVGFPNGEPKIKAMAAQAAEAILAWMRAMSSAEAFDQARPGLASLFQQDAMAIFDKVMEWFRAYEVAAELRAAIPADMDSKPLVWVARPL